ncbi:hypothetical protein EMIT079MI2_110188 [Bacillus sp. IT-79MI2]
MRLLKFEFSHYKCTYDEEETINFGLAGRNFAGKIPFLHILAGIV